MKPDIRELFADAADDSERTGIDAAALLARGRRKVKVRRAGAAAGAGLLAAAVVVGVAQFPREQAGEPIPPANTPTVSVSTPPASPAPSRPESAAQTTGAELIRKLSYAEAVRRCHVRLQGTGTPMPLVIGPGESQREGLFVTDLLRFKMSDGSAKYCSVPGPVQGTFAAWGGYPGEARRACGWLAGANLSSWTLAEQRDSKGGLSATLMSPDRKAMLRCDWDPPDAKRDKVLAFPQAHVFLLYGPQSGKQVGSAPNGVIGAAPDATPIHWLGSTLVADGREFWGGGGIANRGAVRYALFKDGRKLAEAPVRYGIYAMRVLLPEGVAEPNRVIGYDASGKAVEDYQPF